MTPTIISKAEEILAKARNYNEWFTVYGVTWDEYMELLNLTPEQRYPKFTYYNGVLKVMGKQGVLHENISRFLNDLIRIASLTIRVKVISTGSPNKKTLFDDEKDMPPDLVIEIDESSKSSEKFIIYAEFGIKEFWRYDKNTLKIYELDDFGFYREVEQSIAFPILTTEVLNRFLQRRAETDQFDALVEFEMWLREQPNKD